MNGINSGIKSGLDLIGNSAIGVGAFMLVGHDGLMYWVRIVVGLATVGWLIVKTVDCGIRMVAWMREKKHVRETEQIRIKHSPGAPGGSD